MILLLRAYVSTLTLACLLALFSLHSLQVFDEYDHLQTLITIYFS